MFVVKIFPRLGLGLGQQYRDEEVAETCDEFYKGDCSIKEWNEFVLGYKRYVSSHQQQLEYYQDTQL